MHSSRMRTARSSTVTEGVSVTEPARTENPLDREPPSPKTETPGLRSHLDRKPLDRDKRF